MKEKRLRINRIEQSLDILQLDSPVWNQAEEISVTEYWSGTTAPWERHFAARLLWSNDALYVRFEANQHEPLVVCEAPDTINKTPGLWDRDVCEIFIAPDRDEPNRYFEFEVAPTCEWLDLAINLTGERRETNIDYMSGMESAAVIGNSTVTMAIKVKWAAFGKTPAVGDVWRGNLFRCVGKDPDRGYLAWRPTMTAVPNFHVPEAFGEFEFAE
jgi:alpha-galactosidase